MSVLSNYPEILDVEATLRPRPSLNPPLNLVGLITRITFGLTTSELAQAKSLGYMGYLEEQLNHHAIDDSVLAARLAGAEFPTLTMTPEQLAAANTSDVRNQLIRARLIRAVFSRRQLYERMVDLWTDHFNIWLYVDGIAGNQKTWDDATVIRPYALGNFKSMLVASAHSPTMLDYLNNNTNTLTAPNENYARELLELHSLGVDGGYTQQDVQEVARCFTGWTYWGGSTNPSQLRYTFRFNPGTHDNGQKIVLGNIIAAGGGQQDGETVLKIVANHPSTSRFVARKMLRHFWGDHPPDSLVESVASVYRSTDGDIKSMLRVILNPYAPPPEPKFKRPFHLFASGLRALNATINTPGNLQNDLIASGQLPFNWDPPDGYPDTLADWSGLLLPRWNFGAKLLNNQYGGTTVDTNYLKSGLAAPISGAAVAKRINAMMFGGLLPKQEQDALTAYLGATPNDTRIREAYGLAIGSPAFQWY